jgi:hypothetical protein
MALFGAPLAHEDHPCGRAMPALRVQEAVRRYGEDLQGREGVPVHMRAGLNWGSLASLLLQHPRKPVTQTSGNKVTVSGVGAQPSGRMLSVSRERGRAEWLSVAFPPGCAALRRYWKKHPRASFEDGRGCHFRRRLLTQKRIACRPRRYGLAEMTRGHLWRGP